MKITQNELTAAIKEIGLPEETAQKLWAALAERAKWRPRFDLVHILYYAGALIVLGAMTLFLTTAWSLIGAGALFTFACVYMIMFLMMAEWLKDRPGLSVPCGLIATLAVGMITLIVFALQDWLGLWPEGKSPGNYRDFHVWIRSMWIHMELWTLVGGMLILWRYRYPFIVLPLAVCLWYVSMDITPLLFDLNLERPDFSTADQETKDAYFAAKAEIWRLRQMVSVLFGAGMIAFAYLIDRRTKYDYAFWLYLFGLLAFWGGLSSMDSDSELGKFLYALINVGLIGLGLFLSRRAFLVFGSLGVYGYFGYLALKLFSKSLFFPIAAAAFGLSIIWLGILLYRNSARWEQGLLEWLPPGLATMRPAQRELMALDKPK